MGRRSRRRGDGGTLDGAERRRADKPKPRPPRGTFGERLLATADERPKPPWHPFPLVELSILAGIVLIVVGFIKFDDRDGRTMLLMGLVLASLGGLDTAARDHFAGLRSHTLVLSGLPTVLLAGGLFFVRAPWPAIVAAAVAVFAGCFWLFRREFRKRSGGYTFRA